jgi:hypothetical protein
MQGFNTTPIQMGFRPPRATRAPIALTCFKHHVQAGCRRCGGTFLRHHNQIIEASFEIDAQKRGCTFTHASAQCQIGRGLLKMINYGCYSCETAQKIV